LAYNDKFANVYVGDGLKDLGNPVQNYLPAPLPKIEKEFAVPEATPDMLVEQLDPTVEAETAFEDAKKAKDEEGKAEEEGEAEEADE
jgi:radial spoke head protein 4A